MCYSTDNLTLLTYLSMYYVLVLYIFSNALYRFQPKKYILKSKSMFILLKLKAI